MAISLKKGGNVSLTKDNPGLSQITLGMGWDVRSTDGAAFDLDASAFVVNAQGKALSDEHFIYYNNAISPCGSVKHSGDNKTGDGDGDDEAISVDLSKLPTGAETVRFAVTIHDAAARNQNFGQVTNAFIRVFNTGTAEELIRYDLTEDYSTEVSLVMGELYRKDGEWKFRAVGAGFNSGLAGLCGSMGIDAA